MNGKFISTAILATLLVGSNAFASLARLAVMGTEPFFTSSVTVNAVNGSLWYDDDYNVFYNPAYVNDYKNYATMNKGLEGGFFKSEFENYVYGLYVNRNGGASFGNVNTNTSIMAPGFSTLGNYIGSATVLNVQRPYDFFIGGDTGLKWGAHLAWAYNRNQMAGNSNSNSGSAEITARYWHADLGAEVMGFEPFVGLTFLTNYQNNTASQASTAALSEFTGGFRYKYENWTPYFMYHKWRQGGVNNNTMVTQLQTRHNIWGIGVSHDAKLADGVHFIKNVGAWLNAVQDDNGTGFGPSNSTTTVDGQSVPSANQNFTDYVIPVNIALEAEAASWLVLRAGATVDFINDRKYNTSNSNANASPAPITNANQSLAGRVAIRMGSTLKFGKLHIDSAFGNGAATTTGAENLDTSSTGFDGQLFALMSASYHW